jgi:LPS export ABC transporter protein LptC
MTMRFLFLFLITIAPVLAGCTERQTPTGEDFVKIPADMIVIGMTEYMTAQGLRRGRLQGDTAFVYDDSAKVKVKGVRLTIFNDLGAESARLTSREGDFNTADQGMVARGKVVLHTLTGEPREILTEELFYDPNTKRIWSNVETTMIEKGERATGDGFTADDRFQDVQIKNLRGRAPMRIPF